MVYTACTYLMLAGAAWIFLRLLQACFWLPRHLKKQNNVQQMLQDKIDSYEKYVLDCEEKEKAAAEALENGDLIENEEENTEKSEKIKYEPIDEKKWKERRECLEMLKTELKRVRDGGDPYDWQHLLDDDEDDDEKKMNGDKKKEEVEKNDDEKINEKEETDEDKLSEFTIGETESSDASIDKSFETMEHDSEVKKDK
ncbi:hypothetical protein PV327_002067 [Microctonus hyperodae]|uniref:Uncharacterized protein n=1 Tax=Microctonus hyperodae TaxID=165561 RepID=A0AA39FEV1_MICHY|nr:hypothetical protein PV327_002067 [Microctonus hyperodae]